MGRDEYPDYLHESEPDPCTHDWWAFWIAAADRALLVECPLCTTIGTIDDPTAAEMAQAAWVSDDLYRFHYTGDPSRVTTLEIAP